MELKELIKLRKYINKKYKKVDNKDIEGGLELLNKLIREKRKVSKENLT